MSILQAEDLVTSRERTRAGFIAMALEKGYLAKPFVEAARTLKLLSSQVSNPNELLNKSDLRVGLLSAAGLSDKALNYLSEEAKDVAIKGLIDEFLIPAGEDFVNELVYRFLLTKGDSLGGQARNIAGTLGERKFVRSMLSIFTLSGNKYLYLDKVSKRWLNQPELDLNLENNISGLSWNKGNGDRILILNTTVPIVKKNIDLTIFDCHLANFNKNVYNSPFKYIALGELKGGIDPAGADEHWKTASKALTRIRDSFGKESCAPKTFFIGAAIETSMSKEIFSELNSGHLTAAANLTNDEQLAEICQWIVNI